MLSKMSNMTDNDLYQTMCSGSDKEKEEAFKEIYGRYSQRLYVYCRRLVCQKHSADDLFQETMLKLLNSTSSEKIMTNLFGFMVKIARNSYLKSLRDKKAEYVSMNDLDFGFYDDLLEKKELETILASSLELLPVEQREALVLQTYNKLSYQEIGDILDVPVTTVRNWIVRAKKKIREIVAPYFENKTVK